MTKNILILANSISGLYSFRKEVVKAICDAGYIVYISVPEEQSKVDYYNYFKIIGCDIVFTSLNRRGMNPFADLRLMLTYRKLMKKLKPLAVLSYTIKPNVYGGMASRLNHIPQLANVTGLGDAVENGGWLQKLTVFLYKLGLRNAHCIFFQNESNRTFCINAGIASKDSVLLPGSGVNLNHHAFQFFPIEEGKIRFLYIGRLLKDKGTGELFEAARVIKAKYPHVEFQVIADAVDESYQAQFDELIKKDIIRFLGKKMDVRPYIGAVECTIMPSYHEGMSNVNLESAANGRPVITTNVPGCRETVDDGKTGYLVDVKSAQGLIDAIERFIALPYSQKVTMGQEARKKMEREFDRQIVVNAYLSSIEQISHV
jgi:Glycosyltransferase